MPHNNAEKEAAYPKVRVYAATRDLIRQLADEHGASTMAIVRDAVEALIRTGAQKPTRSSRG